MKLSIVILCWNDLKVIQDCLESIFATTHQTDFEVIVSDNGSADLSVTLIRENYPLVRIVENGANLGFAKGNNVGIQASQGEYVLILNPDTIIHDGALDRWIQFAERHPSLIASLWRTEDRCAGWPLLRACGDHFLTVLRKA